MSAQSRPQAAAALREIASGLRASQALYVAAKLNVADHLARRPMNAGELAAATGVDAGALGRVMRALCALGVFSEAATGQFSLLPPGDLLRSDVPGSYRAAVLFAAGEVRWRCWADLLGTVRAGGGAAERTLGLSLFDFYAAHPEESALHDQAMRGISAAQVAAVLRAYDFSEAGVVVDVAAALANSWRQFSQHIQLPGVFFSTYRTLSPRLNLCSGRMALTIVHVWRAGAFLIMFLLKLTHI